jgi:hypothetical protein
MQEDLPQVDSVEKIKNTSFENGRPDDVMI